MKDTSMIEVTKQDSPSENKDKGTSSPRKNQPIVNDAWASGAVSSAGSEVGRTADCFSHKPEEGLSNLAQVEAEPKNLSKESLHEHIERDLESNNNGQVAKDGGSVYDAAMFNKRNCPGDLACTTKFKDGKEEPYEDTADGNCYNVVTSHFTYLPPLAEKCVQTSDLKDASCSQHSFFNMVEVNSDCRNQAMVVTSEPSNERKECIYPVCQKEKNLLIESPFKANVNPLDQYQVKERVQSKERTMSVSKEKDDSYGSVKSSKPLATGKRAWSFGEDILMGSKRMKKSSDQISCSGPHGGESSSFINWISSMTKGFFRSDNVATNPLALVDNPMPDKQRDLFPASVPNDCNKVAASSTVGFASIFKSSYRSRFKGKSEKIVSIGHSGECASSKEHQLENLAIGSNNKRLNHDDEVIKLHKPLPISSVRIGQGACQFGESFPVVRNVSMSSFHVPEKGTDNIQEQCNLHIEGSSSSSLHCSSSPSEGKEVRQLGAFILNKSSNPSIMNKAGSIPGNAWITRFSPKAAAPMECTTQCNQGAFTEAERRTDQCNIVFHHSQNDMNSVRDCQNAEDYHHSALKDQWPISEHLQQYSISPMDFYSKKIHSDVKAKSNLNPIIPSETLKKLEPMASIFAKRLDAFRHIQTSEVADDLTPENATCFFCGNNGHTITSCSHVTESELKDILKNINSIGRAEKPCLCIRCFQHNHWAVECPYASLSSYQHVDGNAYIINHENFVRTIKETRDSPLFSNHGVKISKTGEDLQQQMLSADRIHCEEMSRNVTDFMLQTCFNVDKISEVKGKQIASTSGEVELRDKSYPHFHYLVTMKKPDEQHRIFERIRKLRLSRTDVNRWMESSTSHFSLQGFFLRVRLGKGEGLGGTCYHVACISGASGEKSYGGFRSHLPVNIGGSKCLIDCRFISNHDFVEEELKAWWSGTLQRDGKLPSEEDLDKKLQEREMLQL